MSIRLETDVEAPELKQQSFNVYETTRSWKSSQLVEVFTGWWRIEASEVDRRYGDTIVR